MKINIICIGKAHTEEWKKAIAFFEKRLRPYAKLNFDIIAPPKRNEHSPISQIMEEEAKLILARMKSNDFNLLLDENGKLLDSVKFSQQIEEVKNFHRGDLNIIIGGAYGVSEQVKKAAHVSISLSKLTFPHQMVRVLILEQLYRAFTIMQGTGYHHV